MGLCRAMSAVKNTNALMMGTITPINDQSIHLRFNFSMPKAQSEEHTLYANGFRDEVVHQVGQDIPIWEKNAED